MSQYKIEAATGQHIGARTEQQDRVALFGAPKAPGFMMAVLADGMGGLTGGAQAAEQVIGTARQNFELFSPGEDIGVMLHNIATEAHTVINLSAITAEIQPHSTIVLLVLTADGSAYWAHAGDSRLYHFDGPNVASRTVDHSYVEKLIASGKLQPEEAKDHRLASLLTNVLGSTTEKLFVTHGECHGLKPGDAFLLCSDGLWHHFEDSELGVAIAGQGPRAASEMLIRKARERTEGTNADNCTLAIVKLSPVAKEPPAYKPPKVLPTVQGL
ncbi:MAG: Serine/threonine protein phosphatase [Herminiimonas sp.]|nr:Serine/threonine protein phosphatase [Herminiimonas sp.]